MMIKTIIETAKLIFTSEESQKVDELTKNKHQESEKIMFRNLDEISSKFGISGVYTLNEITGADNNNSIQYEFQEVKIDVKMFIKKSFKENLGTLFIIDEEKKKIINTNFSLKEERLNSPLLNKSRLSSAPDFVYEIEGQQVWVTLSSIRNQEEEVKHTEFLELLYRALINTNQIDIDANFDSYSSSIEEKTYELVRFRLDRNSLFLVIRDKENERLYLSHEFRHISSINYIATEDRLKFWLDMIDVTYRFWLPFKKEELFAEHIQIDPIIYRN